MKTTKNISVRVLGIFIAIVSLCVHSASSIAQPNFQIDADKIELIGGTRPFKSDLEIERLSVDRYQVFFRLHASAPSIPPEFSLTFRFPKDKVNQLWNSQTWSNRSFFSLPSYDRAAADFSIVSGLTLNDQNQITFTSDDRFDSRYISTFVQEENDTLIFGLGFFEDNPPISQMQEYEVRILVDFRNIPFSEAVYDASKWRLNDLFQQAAIKKQNDDYPVYSTWYPMHRNIPLENITRELDSLTTFGFKSILVDDGWRSLVKMKVDTMYDYEENSLQTMHLFNEKRKEMGLKLYLWYSLPFMGGNPVITKKFAPRYIRYKAPMQTHVLDPRYPEIRNHLVSTYVNFYESWPSDGFWFDFLNEFYPNAPTIISDDLGRDFIDTQLAIDQLMDGMNQRLQKISPGIFMGQEFASAGPDQAAAQSFLAGFVGINSAPVVREKMVNNRLLYGRHTPFMEIMGVHPRDKSEEVARKLQAILFGNPHLSFFTTTLPEDTKETIRFWLDYWRENRKILMESEFEPMQVANQYPIIKVASEAKIIYGLYADYNLSLPLVVEQPIDVINAKESSLISFVVNHDGSGYDYEMYNYMGQLVAQDHLKTKRKNTVEVEVPSGGFIRFLPDVTAGR